MASTKVNLQILYKMITHAKAQKCARGILYLSKQNKICG
eukprot:UN07248